MDPKIFTWSDVAQVQGGQRVSVLGQPLRGVPVPAAFHNWLQHEPVRFPGSRFFVLPPAHCFNHSKFEQNRSTFVTVLASPRPRTPPQ